MTTIDITIPLLILEAIDREHPAEIHLPTLAEYEAKKKQIDREIQERLERTFR